VVSYSFEEYEVLVTEAVTVTTDVTLTSETTSLDGDRNNLSVASYNLENLDPGDSAQKFDVLAKNIVLNLSAPDILMVQEMQDGNGANGTDPLSAQPTADLLIAAIRANGGPGYVYAEIAPATANSTGGEPGGNIRNGFFYNPDRVSLVEGGLTLITDPAFNGTRKPLVGNFEFNGEQVTLINVHLTSRLGSEPLWGANQPPANAGEGAREAQTAAVRSYVESLISKDSDANVLVAGDFNAFPFEKALTQLETGRRCSPTSTGCCRRRSATASSSEATSRRWITCSSRVACSTAPSSTRCTSTPNFRPAPSAAPTTIRCSPPSSSKPRTRLRWRRRTATSLPATVRSKSPAPACSPTTPTLTRMRSPPPFVSGPINGTLSLSSDGSFVYTPNAGFVGTDTFTYRASDADGANSTATVSVDVLKTPTRVGDGVRAERVGGQGNEDLRAVYGDRDGTLIDAGAGNDTLRGGVYDDTLIGGAGDDQMFAGAGADEFRFFGTDIEGASDSDRLYDLNFGEGDTLSFAGFGAGTFSDGAFIDANQDGTGALISSYKGLVEAAKSDDVTAFRQGAGNNNLVVRIENANGQVQELIITGGWSQFTANGGEAMM
jgi:endonuclease/exonuclease/phosphatase family metal-dependent hydrolase